MLLSGNLWLSMASLVICMHIRFLCNELQKLYIKHLTYHRVVFDMEHRYPHVNHEGECLICWETFRLILYFQNKAAFNKLKMKEISLGSFFFRLPKSEDQITGHRFEISSNGFLHVIGNRLVRALKLVSDVTGNRKCVKKIIH